MLYVFASGSGVAPGNPGEPGDFMSVQVTKEDMIVKLQELARKYETESIARHQFLRESGFSERQIGKLFGTYNGLVQAAGLRPRIFPVPDKPTHSDDFLLQEIVRVLRLPESKMTRIFFDQNAYASSTACERRFGGWINALKEASTLLDSSVDKDLIEKVSEYISPRSGFATRVSSITKSIHQPGELTDDESRQAPLQAQVISGENINVYGDFINFRGLQHAPVNEQGVVFLFGMICRELGYVVEIIKSSYPDCEAKRAIRNKPGKWQRVRIEFEFASRNFKSHGHDPEFCDVIVCWEHNWPDCPIEVLELSSAVKALSSDLSTT